MAEAIKEVPDGVVVSVWLGPRAAKTSIDGPHGDFIKIRVAAPPSGGAANRALCEVLADLFSSSAEIVSGTRSRHKRVKIDGVDIGAAKAMLGLTAE